MPLCGIPPSTPTKNGTASAMRGPPSAHAAVTPDLSYYVLRTGLSPSHRASGPDRPGGTVPAGMMVGAMSLTQSALASIFAEKLPAPDALAASVSWNKLLLVQLNAL